MARQLVWSLADREITRIVSSPLARCLESVVPLAESRHLVVESRWELEPDVPLDDLLTLLVDLPDTSLACTHREVFENLLGWDVTCDKGGAWVLDGVAPSSCPRSTSSRLPLSRAAERYGARTA